jgi:hypothetical protein
LYHNSAFIQLNVLKICTSFDPKLYFLGQKINYLPSCQSTNDVAASLINTETALDGTVVITGNQTAGRGQRGNQWEAQPGQNLTFFGYFTAFVPSGC